MISCVRSYKCNGKYTAVLREAWATLPEGISLPLPATLAQTRNLAHSLLETAVSITLINLCRADKAGPHDGNRDWCHLHHLWVCKQELLPGETPPARKTFNRPWLLLPSVQEKLQD